MREGNFFKLGESINYDLTMNWLDFGFHKLKGQGHHKMKYEEKFNFGAITPIKLLSMDKTHWGSVKHFWKFEV